MGRGPACPPPPPGGPTVQYRIVDRPEELAPALRTGDAPTVGVDVERSTKPRWENPAALVQVGIPDRAVLVDTHVLGPVPVVGDFLRDRVVVLHAATNDIASMDRAAIELDTLEDTSIAAGLLGLPLGLDDLLGERLGVSLSPDKQRFQRADWERRPLPDDMADYAAGDVVHLPELITDLRGLLAARGRLDWYRQERDHMIDTTRAATRRWQDTRGAGRLTPQQRAVLRALWLRRERVAEREDLAPQRVLRDATLLDLASDPAEDAAALARRNKRRGAPTRDVATELLAAQEEGRHAEPRPRDAAGRHFDATDRDRQTAMRHARSAHADELGVSAGLLCPSRVLWAGIAADPTGPDELVDAMELRPWQRDQLRHVLWEAYTSVSG